MLKRELLIACWAMFFFGISTARAELVFDGVPLPDDVTPLTVEASASPFAGLWSGSWGGSMRTLLAVESLDDEGNAGVAYGVAGNPAAGIDGGWIRYAGKVDEHTLTITGKRSTITYTRSPTGKLKAVFGDGQGFAVMTRHTGAWPLSTGTALDWGQGRSEHLATALEENGKPVHLEAVIFAPPGTGPFPLAVVNHGSTGSGDGSVPFNQTWTDPWLAEFLNERGWLVAFPQRRGRGKSQGQYDEGFAVDRSQGYTCDRKRSLAGADRALADIHAAIGVLRKRSDVTEDPILLAGLSRGGVLSVAYAGQHPQTTLGVINFVGGWIGDACRSAKDINQTLFRRGGKFPDPTLWLYGHDDVFYAMDHSRENFQAFRDAGGKGEFFASTVRGENNGHWVLSVPPLWEKRVEGYLDTIRR